ncbi:response regulator receiver protein [Trichodesmium erythraeum IMS101]|uniref:Response regulator receiver protein n=1 Tax=Trichodesmium erythraeum (strain IMS101) TaxID=203124 RepID=Q116K7_TRIEI
MRAQSARTTPLPSPISVFFLLKYSSVPEHKFLSIYSFQLACHPVRITGYGNVELAKRTLTKGVFDFIEKSATAVEDLVSAVQRAIDTRKEKIRRVGNPFTPMTGLEPTVFGGRWEQDSKLSAIGKTRK